MGRRVWLVVLLLGLAGCAAGHPVVAPSTPTALSTATVSPSTPAAHSYPVSCLIDDALQYQDDGSRYPADFVPVQATRCILVDGTRVEQIARHGLDGLVRALKQPSEPRQALPCPLPAPIGITLTDAGGRSIVPNPPRDFCGRPLASVLDAIEALPWERR